jgi:predicted HD superfamily hydrolase involved in NAD metabolism
MNKPITEEMLNDLRENVAKILSAKRMRHTLEVEKMVIRLAAMYQPEKTDLLRAAALLHDITKEYDDKVQLSILTKPGIEFSFKDHHASKTFHARTAALLIPELYPEFADDEIISAIRWHTTGRENMTLCEKLLYLSDYIDMSRDFEDCVKLRDMFFSAKPEEMNEEERLKHLDRVLLASYDINISALIRKNSVISVDTLNARNSLLCELHNA